MRTCCNSLYLYQYGIGIRPDQWKRIKNVKINPGEEDNLTYGQGSIFNLLGKLWVLHHMVLVQVVTHQEINKIVPVPHTI